MKVRDILDLIPRGTVVQVYQKPIARMDSCKEPVLRQIGEVSVLSDSKQNYLDYKTVRIEQKAGLLTVLCEASPEQEMKTIAAYYAGR